LSDYAHKLNDPLKAEMYCERQFELDSEGSADVFHKLLEIYLKPGKGFNENIPAALGKHVPNTHTTKQPTQHCHHHLYSAPTRNTSTTFASATTNTTIVFTTHHHSPLPTTTHHHHHSEGLTPIRRHPPPLTATHCRTPPLTTHHHSSPPPLTTTHHRSSPFVTTTVVARNSAQALQPYRHVQGACVAPADNQGQRHPRVLDSRDARTVRSTTTGPDLAELAQG
jgi:hypothetical protein